VALKSYSLAGVTFDFLVSYVLDLLELGLLLLTV